MFLIPQKYIELSACSEVDVFYLWAIWDWCLQISKKFNAFLMAFLYQKKAITKKYVCQKIFDKGNDKMFHSNFYNLIKLTPSSSCSNSTKAGPNVSGSMRDWNITNGTLWLSLPAFTESNLSNTFKSQSHMRTAGYLVYMSNYTITAIKYVS